MAAISSSFRQPSGEDPGYAETPAFSYVTDMLQQQITDLESALDEQIKEIVALKKQTWRPLKDGIYQPLFGGAIEVRGGELVFHIGGKAYVKFLPDNMRLSRKGEG